MLWMLLAEPLVKRTAMLVTQKKQTVSRRVPFQAFGGIECNLHLGSTDIITVRTERSKSDCIEAQFLDQYAVSIKESPKSPANLHPCRNFCCELI